MGFSASARSAFKLLQKAAADSVRPAPVGPGHPAGRRPTGVDARPLAPASRSEREFARARRHSRLVRTLKIGMPLLALAIVAGFVIVTWVARSLPGDVSVQSLHLDDGRVVMEDPRLSGFDRSGRPYTMVADRAIQSLNGGGVDLEGVRANVTVSSDSTADITAVRGHYDQDGDKLRLADGITVETSNGMTIDLKEASIDLSAGDLKSTQPVSIKMPSQTIQSGTLSVGGGGKRLTFGDGVKMTLLPTTTGTASGSTSSP